MGYLCAAMLFIITKDEPAEILFFTLLKDFQVRALLHTFQHIFNGSDFFLKTTKSKKKLSTNT